MKNKRMGPTEKAYNKQLMREIKEKKRKMQGDQKPNENLDFE